MNVKIIIAIIAAILIAAVIIAPVGKGDSQALIAPELQNNPIAQKIAALGIEVAYEELGQDGNGYIVNGQAWQISYSDGSEEVVKVILDDDIDPNSEYSEAVLAHELGHIVNNGPNDNEANADAYAESLGYHIVDAYHGIH